MIDLSIWSLNKLPITIERYEGTYANGLFSLDLVKTIETFGSAQPYTTIESDQAMSQAMGENVEKPLIVYLTQRVYMNDSRDPEHKVRDLLVIDGRKWQPMTVNNWGFLSLNHYRVVARIYDGN